MTEVVDQIGAWQSRERQSSGLRFRPVPFLFYSRYKPPLLLLFKNLIPTAVHRNLLRVPRRAFWYRDALSPHTHDCLKTYIHSFYQIRGCSSWLVGAHSNGRGRSASSLFSTLNSPHLRHHQRWRRKHESQGKSLGQSPPAPSYQQSIQQQRSPSLRSPRFILLSTSCKSNRRPAALHFRSADKNCAEHG